jgi:hypothetical protein
VNFLRTWNASRYGTLDLSQRNAFGTETITNDALSYDAFSQAAQAVRSPVGVDPLGGLEPQRVIATGHSQSASRLVTYVNAIQPLSHAFDAFALHGSLGNAVRVDLEVPVWKVLSEYDVNGFLEAQVRRPDDGRFRTWEVAGTSHVDRKTHASRVPLELRDVGVAVEDSLACGIMPPGSAVPFHYVMAAGLEHLVHWVQDGTPMPSAAPLETVSIFPSVVLARDGFGNALGGIRLAQMDVPTAVHSGTNTGPGACPRWGYTLAFDAETLATLYPDYAGYLALVSDVTDRNRSDGFLLEADAIHQLPDADDDSIDDAHDDCLGLSNPDQIDTDHDGFGNACDADYDGNGVVGAGDFLRLRQAYGSTLGSPSYDAALDADGDGAIGSQEFVLLRSTFGQPPGPSGLACAASGSCP